MSGLEGSASDIERVNDVFARFERLCSVMSTVKTPDLFGTPEIFPDDEILRPSGSPFAENFAPFPDGFRECEYVLPVTPEGSSFAEGFRGVEDVSMVTLERGSLSYDDLRGVLSRVHSPGISIFIGGTL